MSKNQCLDTSQSHFNNFTTDGTQSTQNFSKICQNCRLLRDELEAQIFLLKDKAHQSFMQVIQVQQLHEQQLQLINIQHQDQITDVKKQIDKLEKQVSKANNSLVAMQKNTKHHVCEVQSLSFIIENIDIIHCNQQDGKQSSLDQSSYVQFNEFVDDKGSNFNDVPLKQQVESARQLSKNKEIDQKIQRLNSRVVQLESEVQSLWQTNQQLKRESIKHQNNAKTMKNNYDSLYKQSKFMSDHIRILSNDKFKLQRKVKELDKLLKQFKDKGNLKKSSTFQQESNPIIIKFNGSDMFNSQQFINVRNSLQNSKEENNIEGSIILNGMSLNLGDLYKPKSASDILTKSEMFLSNQEIKIQQNMRKSIPNYIKINHIPSFRKVLSDNKIAKQQQDFLKMKEQMYEEQKSDFMEQIRKQVQLKNIRNKSNNRLSNEGLRSSLFKQNMQKRYSKR